MKIYAHFGQRQIYEYTILSVSVSITIVTIHKLSYLITDQRHLPNTTPISHSNNNDGKRWMRDLLSHLGVLEQPHNM